MSVEKIMQDLFCLTMREKRRSGFGDDEDEEDLHSLPLLSNDDLIQEILVRLPVKSLGQCKSVCKSWLALIQSSSFIHLHTTFNSSSSSSSNNNNFGSFIFLASAKEYSSLQHSLIRLSVDSESNKSESDGGWRWWRNTGHKDVDVSEYEDQEFSVDNLDGVVRLESLGVGGPQCYQKPGCFKKIVGCCDGIVCLFDRDRKQVSLWNPETKQIRNLPRPLRIPVDQPRHLVAFGFDVEIKDYKVVLLSGYRPEFYRSVSPMECFCQVQVYNLSTDSWRLVEGITCLPGDPFRYPNEVLYLNGSCFFMAHFFRTKHHQLCIPENDRFIISFDLTKESITPIQLPDHHRDQKLHLSCLDDKKICLFTGNYHREYPPITDEYSTWSLFTEQHISSNSMNMDSWEKLHSFEMLIERPGETNIPRGISNDARFVFLEINDAIGFRKRLKLYDTLANEVKKNFLFCCRAVSKAYAYKPNPLVSIKGGNGSAAY